MLLRMEIRTIEKYVNNVKILYILNYKKKQTNLLYETKLLSFIFKFYMQIHTLIL